MNAGIRQLDVLWRVPGHRRFHVGVLSHDDEGGYRFEYVPAAELLDAKEAGFAGIPGLASAGSGVARSRHLFATFAQRIPSNRRPDFARLMAEWNVADPSDKFEILARSGGLLLTDHLELCEHRELGDDLSVPLSFLVAGMRHYGDPDATLAKVGDPVSLRRDPDNRFDPDAVEVNWCDRSIGYVPRQYSRLIASLLKGRAPLEGLIERRLLVPHEGPRWVVRVSNAALTRVA